MFNAHKNRVYTFNVNYTIFNKHMVIKNLPSVSIIFKLFAPFITNDGTSITLKISVWVYKPDCSVSRLLNVG